MKKKIFSCSKFVFAFFILFFLIFLIYSNSFDCSWQFDDEHNILKNPKIHVQNFYPSDIFDTFQASISGGTFASEKIYRPVSMFSFAVNWYFGQDNVFGYHIVNTFIHLFSSVFLFFSIILLFKTPNIKNQYSDIFIFNCALITSVLWAVHPINVQAVTYIVQRMASLAALFYMIVFFSYLKGRLAEKRVHQNLFFSLCIAFFFLSIGSKENTALFPLTILLVELLFFHEPVVNVLKNKKIVISFFIFLIFFGILLFNIFLNNRFPSFTGRSFTISERFLTEFRILIKYLFQIFYPAQFQFSIEHSINVSKSLFEPVTTILSIFAISGGIVFSIAKAKECTFFAFAVFFFLINHIVESSFIPLELIFEHRNYLPSMFIFLPFVIGYLNLVNYYSNKNLIVYFCLNIFLAFIILAVGMGTYSRNFDWKTPVTLWADAAEKAPENARPLQNLSFYFYEKKGFYDEAIVLHKKALELKDNSLQRSKANSYLNLSNLYLKTGNKSAAVSFAAKAYKIKPTLLFGRNYVKILLSVQNYAKAEKILETLFKEYKFDTEVLNLRTYTFLLNNKFHESYDNSLLSIKKSPFDKMALKMFAFSCFVTGQHKKADSYLRKSLNTNPDDKLILALCLIQNSINEKQIKRSNLYVKKLIQNFDINTIKTFFENSNKSRYSFLKLSYGSIRNEISKALQHESDTLRTMNF